MGLHSFLRSLVLLILDTCDLISCRNIKSLPVSMLASSNNIWACLRSFPMVLTRDRWFVYMVLKCLYSKAFSQGLSLFSVNAQYDIASTNTLSYRVAMASSLISPSVGGISTRDASVTIVEKVSEIGDESSSPSVRTSTNSVLTVVVSVLPAIGVREDDRVEKQLFV